MSKWFTFSNGLTFTMSDQEALDYENKNKCYVVRDFYRDSNPDTYDYEFENGVKHKFTPLGAKIYEKTNNTKKISGGPLGHYTKSGSSDLYSGYNPALGMHVKGKAHYNQVLKERGLIEIGNEKKYIDALKPKRDKLFTEDTARKLKSMGSGLSDGEIKKLIDKS